MSGGGAERILNTILYDIQDEFDVTLVLIESKISYDLPKNTDIVVLAGVVGDSSIVKLMNIGMLAFKLARLSNRLKADYTFSLTTRPNLINSLSKYFRNKAVNIIYEVTTPSKIYSRNNFLSRVMCFFIRTAYPMANTIICNSHGVSHDLKVNFGIKKNIETVYSPIDIKHVKEQANAACSLIDDSAVNLITVGRLDYGKNHEMMIRAFANIKNKNSYLYILGEGELELYLKGVAQDLNIGKRVIFLGFDNNPYKYLKKCDIFLFSSKFEGFPTVLIEALACQLPVISTDCKSGPREILSSFNSATTKEKEVEFCEFGILTELDNQNSFTNAIDLMISSNGVREDFKGKSLFRAGHFSKEKSIPCLLKVITSQCN